MHKGFGLLFLIALSWCFLAGCGSDQPAVLVEPDSDIQFVDVSASSGIDFVHTDGSSGHRYIVETITAGLALMDFDNDHQLDIYLLNGAALPDTAAATPAQNGLYRNGGECRFENVTNGSMLGDQGYGLGVAVADYDQDGFVDVFLNNFGPNALYHNNGDGTFTDVTDSTGIERGDHVGAGVCFLDIENDGDLDLYVANYVDFTFENHLVQNVAGHPVYAGPRDYDPVPDSLYRNDGDGTFTDVSDVSGIGRVAGTGMGMVAADYDGDGDTDVFVLNDVTGNFFFQNDGTGRFQEVGLTVGAAYNLTGEELGSMGVDCGDYDNDGWLDFLMTSYQGQRPVLYRNLEGRNLEDVTLEAGAGEAALPHVNWGVGLVDFNNDGYRDIFYACGHLYDNVRLFSRTTDYEVQNIVLRNNGQGKFVEVTGESGDGLLPRRSSRGAAFDDLDGDGGIDAVVLNARREPTILRNTSPKRGNWWDVRLIGIASNRDGVGARVTVSAGALQQVAEVHSGRGYQSHFGTRLHFGLDTTARIDSVTVRWPNGTIDTLRDIAVNRTLTLIEGATRSRS